jgi:tetratricopeptide (TPR) repeat protein
MNNLACIALEAGDWDKAHIYLRRIGEKFEALEAAHDATLPLLMNEANILLYQGRATEALSLFARCRDTARANGITEFDPELLACIGISGIQIGDSRLAQRSLVNLQAYDSSHLLGIQERFKIEWFRGFMRLCDGNTDGMADELLDLAQIYADKDRLESAKLEWLAFLLSTSRYDKARMDTELDKLSSVGLRWFGYFSRRWLRKALR